jgi:TolB-like protein
MKKCITWIVFISFCSFILVGNTSLLYAQQTSKQTIAVLNMEARGGVSRSGAQTLSDRLRSELVNLGVFAVLERGQMYTILQEQGFNLQGCTTSDCAVEAGRLLGVQRMVAGDVGKIGDVITIDMRVFDVETGTIIRAHQSDYRGDVSGLLNLMKKIAREISGLKVEEDKVEGFPWLWVAIGAVAVGGGAAVFLLGGGTSESDGDGPEPGSLPNPTWPPGN